MNVPSHHDTGPGVEVEQLTKKLVERLTTHDEVLGVIRTGSLPSDGRDQYSDHDFLLICTLAGPAAEAVRATAERLGLTRDDATSRHYPLDDDGYLTHDDECFEIALIELGEIERQIRAVYSGEELDEGLLHLLLAGRILFDRFGTIASLIDRTRARDYPTDALGKLLKTKPNTALKLLRSAVYRGDVPLVAYWLARLYEDSMRVILAHNRAFYPGPKRSFQRLEDLKWVPDGFQRTYAELFAAGATSECLLERAVDLSELVVSGPPVN